MKSFLKKNRSRILRKFRVIFMQISCEFANNFFEKRLHYCTTIASQKSCEKSANRRAASEEKPTPGPSKLPTCTAHAILMNQIYLTYCEYNRAKFVSKSHNSISLNAQEIKNKVQFLLI